jgi:hypothetical protein
VIELPWSKRVNKGGLSQPLPWMALNEYRSSDNNPAAILNNLPEGPILTNLQANETLGRQTVGWFLRQCFFPHRRKGREG